MISRRQFLKSGAVAGAGLVVVNRLDWSRTPTAGAVATPQTQLPGSAIAQFVDALPLLSVAGGPMETVIAGTAEVTLTMREFQANVMPSTFVPAIDAYGGTWVWGYRAGVTPTTPAGTYIGPVIVASRGTPTQVRYVNDLTTNEIAWRDWTDQTLHWADPLNGGANTCAHTVVAGQPPTGYCADHYPGPIPAVPHLHGGEVPPVIDGGPDAWFTARRRLPRSRLLHRTGWRRQRRRSTAIQTPRRPAPLWFHDHVLGATRLNVYAGLAGAYLLIDPSLALPTGLHPVGLQQGASGRSTTSSRW